MRWGSLISTAILTSASMAAPRLAFRSLGMDQAGLTAMIAAAQSTTSGQGMDEKVMRQLKAIETGQLEGASLEQLAAAQDIAKKGGVGRQADAAMALMDAFRRQKPLKEQFRASVLGDAETLRRFYRGQRAGVIIGLGLLGTGAFLAAVAGAFPFGRPVARFLLTFLFALSSYFLVLVSMAAVVFFAAARLNPWPLLPGEVLIAPAGFMLLSGLFVRMLDPNYPLWNSLLRGMGSPILGCLAVAGAGFLPPGAKKALSALLQQ